MTKSRQPKHSYLVIISFDPKIKRYSAIVPLLSGCGSDGDTFEEALKNVADAVRLYLKATGTTTKTKVFAPPIATLVTV